MRSMTKIAAIALIAVVAAAPRQALAQDAGEANAHVRSGFWFNGGLAYGTLGCGDCTDREGGMTANLTFGGTLSQKVLLGGSSRAWRKSENGITLTASAVTGTIRFYPSETGGFYLLGGLGVGTVDVGISDLGDASETGGAAVLGLGLDIRISDNVSLTPYLNGVGISYDGGDANFNQLGLSITTH